MNFKLSVNSICTDRSHHENPVEENNISIVETILKSIECTNCMENIQTPLHCIGMPDRKCTAIYCGDCFITLKTCNHCPNIFTTGEGDKKYGNIRLAIEKKELSDKAIKVHCPAPECNDKIELGNFDDHVAKGGVHKNITTSNDIAVQNHLQALDNKRRLDMKHQKTDEDKVTTASGPSTSSDMTGIQACQTASKIDIKKIVECLNDNERSNLYLNFENELDIDLILNNEKMILWLQNKYSKLNFTPENLQTILGELSGNHAFSNLRTFSDAFLLTPQPSSCETPIYSQDYYEKSKMLYIGDLLENKLENKPGDRRLRRNLVKFLMGFMDDEDNKNELFKLVSFLSLDCYISKQDPSKKIIEYIIHHISTSVVEFGKILSFAKGTDKYMACLLNEKTTETPNMDSIRKKINDYDQDILWDISKKIDNTQFKKILPWLLPLTIAERTAKYASTMSHMNSLTAKGAPTAALIDAIWDIGIEENKRQEILEILKQHSNQE